MLKAVILAAGNGLRLRPLTIARPKPLMRIIDKTVLEHNLDSLKGIVNEVIIVVGYKSEMIRDLIKDNYRGIKIRYVVQEEQLGTGDAAKKASEFIDDKFILLNGDDIYFKEDIKKCIKRNPSILLGKVDNPSNFGVVECQEKFVKNLVEKPEIVPEQSLVNTGLYYLDKSIFDLRIEKSSRGEYEFTDYIRGLILNERLSYHETDRWMPISYPWNLLSANEKLLSGIKRNIAGSVEKGALIKGAVVVEKGAVIGFNSYLEGPVYIKKGALIGPNAVIRPKTIIGEESQIGSGVEIKNSIIGDKVNIRHLSYIGDSIIDDYCNIGAGTILANLRFDKKHVFAIVKGKKVDTERIKFGSVVGEKTEIGVNSSLMPGVLVNPGTRIKPHSLVKRNDEENQLVIQ